MYILPNLIICYSLILDLISEIFFDSDHERIQDFKMGVKLNNYISNFWFHNPGKANVQIV